MGQPAFKQVILRQNPVKYRANQLSSMANLIISTFFWLYSATCLLPILLVIIVSFSNEKSVVINGYNFFPKVWSTESYSYLFHNWQQIGHSYGISLFQAIVGTSISLLIMTLYAYPISRKEFPHKNFFSFFIFFTMLFNGGLIPWYLVYTQMLSLKNSIWSLILPHLVPAFFVLILRTFFATSIPSELIDSAKIDGAGDIRIFAKIVLPLSLPVLATIALFQVLGYWNDWFLSMVFITDNITVNLQYLMYKTMLNVQILTSNSQMGQGLVQAGGTITAPSETLRMAMVVLGIGPIVFAYPFFQKYYVKGLTVGALKG
jgi:putative aldouronate transport system permease protein